MNVNTAITAALFVEFVYNNWNTNGNNLTDLTGKEVTNLAGAPVCAGKTYKVTQTLYSNDLATDIHPDQPLNDFKTIGIVAVNSNDPTDIVIAIRGTANIWEWIQDFKFLPIPFSPVPAAGSTEDGFTDMYLSFSLTPALKPNFISDLVALFPKDQNGHTTANVIVAGHSLGAALSTLLSLDLAVNSRANIVSITLASPRVGDLAFFNYYNHAVPNAYRVANRMDIVPKTPLPPLYLHVGDETELIPRDVRFDLGCEHSLVSYLHLLGLLPGASQQFALSGTCVENSTAPTSKSLTA